MIWISNSALSGIAQAPHCLLPQVLSLFLQLKFTAHDKLTCRPRDARGRDAEAVAHWLQVGGAFLLVWAAALAKEIGITTVRSAPCQYLSVRHLVKGMDTGAARRALCCADEHWKGFTSSAPGSLEFKQHVLGLMLCELPREVGRQLHYEVFRRTGTPSD